ncbi:MAG TPA: addiction module protein [Bryobacteraceae bacterium]|nr:addiction module protein [Bryobacteraceae bacterium]
MPNPEDVLRDALVLDAHERAALAEKLLASLDEQQDNGNLDQAEAERLWAREAQQRLEAYRAGRTIPVPAQQVHAKAEKLLQ